MNEMNMRNYDDRDYDDRNYRYDERNYRYDERDYDRRGGRINNRDYRNYRNYRDNYRDNYRNYREDYREELEMQVEDMREMYRKLEDIADMAENSQDKNTIMRVAQKEKENYHYLKQIMDR